MLSWRRALLLVSVVLVAAVAWSVWLAVQTAKDLSSAESSVETIRAAVTSQDSELRDSAIEELQAASSEAADRTDGVWWSGLTRLPLVGDDAAGVRDLSASLELVSRAMKPLGQSLEGISDVLRQGGIDIDVLKGLQGKVAQANTSIFEAASIVQRRDSTGFVGALRTRYNEYVETISGLRDDLASAETAVSVLPTMLGSEEQRRYLLIFENNAEIRATGGLPGSWASMTADDGKLVMEEQGAATDFDQYAEPIGDVTPEEEALFGPEIGRFFLDPNLTPDFPRAAQIFAAFWKDRYPDRPLDGVISIDVVALSYLLNGLGEVSSGDLTLTSDSVVTALLSDVYADPDPAAQDETFREIARAIFDDIANGPSDPVAFVQGVGQAAQEGRLRVTSFDARESEALDETRVVGELATDEGATPHVDIALNDATASKMSYYLRYSNAVTSRSCDAGAQRLEATLIFSQSISRRDAQNLPDYVTGSSDNGVERGQQLVRAHIFAPFAGAIGDITIDGQEIVAPEVVIYRGRPAVTLTLEIGFSEDVVVSIQMDTGPGQTDAGLVKETPSVVPGSNTSGFDSTC